MDRGTRRARTLAIGLRRLKEHRSLTYHHISDPYGRTGTCFCDGCGPHLFAKRGEQTHDCRKRTFGNPRVARWMCKCGMRDRIYQWRQENKLREWQHRVELEYGKEPATDKENVG